MCDQLKLSNEIQAFRIQRHMRHQENKIGRYFTNEEVLKHNLEWVAKYAKHFRRWFVTCRKWKIHTNGRTFMVVGKKALRTNLELYSGKIRQIDEVK